MGESISCFSTATQMLAALDAGDITSVDLVEMHLDRIDTVDGDLNAVVVRTTDRARDAAKRADERRAAGERGSLLGLPVTLKESTQVAGLPQSAGMPAFAEYVPDRDGMVAQRVFGAGACLLGKTNIPFALADWQADSEIYGRTNNPWDLDRTPGGSTGGGAAALATGMTPLEIGSDIGGSIRVPAAFCGVYGHRPSETALPRSGAFPLGDDDNPGVVMGVHGPLARSVADLQLLFSVVAGPVSGEARGWRLDLPPARHERLADFRVAVMPPLDLAAPSVAMRGAVDRLAGFLSDVGATVAEAMPAVDHDAYFQDYLTTLTLITTQGMGEAERQVAARKSDGPPEADPRVRGLSLSAHDYLALLNRREQARRQWSEFFESWDVLVCPTTMDAAFAHRSDPPEERELTIDDRTVPYRDLIVYPMWAIFPGQPATAFPGGRDPRGLPLGLQAIGPYLEDATTLRFARLLEEEWQAFEAPPDYR